jgi:hypothetical protein
VYETPKVYLSAEVAGGASIAISLDNLGVTALGAATAQMATIASETTLPTGIGGFSSPTTAGTGLAPANIGIAQVVGIWVRRTAANTSALTGDGVTLAVTGDTGSL